MEMDLSKSGQRQNLFCMAAGSTLVLLLLGILPPIVWAEPRLPHLFSDHMVLQGGTELRVWGWSDPGESIEVSLAGTSRQTAATRDGRWSVSLPLVPAGGPFTLEVRGNRTLRFKDVMIGEVWVASGQSNMTYALAGTANAAQDVRMANDPDLRFFTVPKKIALEAQTDTLPTTWEVSTSDTAKKFSAVAYFFGRDLRRSLGVPVGIILSSWPGTQGEEWTDPESLHRDPILQPIVSHWDSASSDEKAFAARSRGFSLEFDDFELLPVNPASAPVSFSNFDDGSSAVSTGGAWSYSWQEAPDSQFELVAPGRGGKGYAARISGALDGTSDSRLEVRLHSDGSPMDLSSYSGARFCVRGNGSFVFRTLEPSISDWDDYSTGILRATPEWKEITVWFKDLKQAGWGVAEKLTLDQILGFSISATTDLRDPPRPPSGLYEGMVSPLMQSALSARRGAVETHDEAKRCAELFRSRADTIDGMIVTLPNFGDERAIADTLRLARLSVPVLVQATPDTPGKMGITHRRDSFCGKMSACNNLKQYGISYSLTTLHTESLDSPEFAKDLEWFAAVCRVVKGLRNLRIGAPGARPAAFNTVRYSEKLLEANGVSVETFDLSEVLGRISRMSDNNDAVVQKLQSIQPLRHNKRYSAGRPGQDGQARRHHRSVDEGHRRSDQRRAVLDFAGREPRRRTLYAHEHDERLASFQCL